MTSDRIHDKNASFDGGENEQRKEEHIYSPKEKVRILGLYYYGLLNRKTIAERKLFIGPTSFAVRHRHSPQEVRSSEDSF